MGSTDTSSHDDIPVLWENIGLSETVTGEDHNLLPFSIITRAFGESPILVVGTHLELDQRTEPKKVNNT